MLVYWFTNSVHENYKLRTQIVSVSVLTFRTIYVHNMFCGGKSMNNLLSYCGLVHVSINASDKDLPVLPHFYVYESIAE